MGLLLRLRPQVKSLQLPEHPHQVCIFATAKSQPSSMTATEHAWAHQHFELHPTFVHLRPQHATQFISGPSMQLRQAVPRSSLSSLTVQCCGQPRALLLLHLQVRHQLLHVTAASLARKSVQHGTHRCQTEMLFTHTTNVANVHGAQVSLRCAAGLQKEAGGCYRTQTALLPTYLRYAAHWWMYFKHDSRGVMWWPPSRGAEPMGGTLRR